MLITRNDLAGELILDNFAAGCRQKDDSLKHNKNPD